MRRPARGPRPVAVVGAGMLAVSYSLVLVGVAAVLTYGQVSGTGNIGSEHLDRVAVRGLITVALLLAVGAGTLVSGAWRLVTAGRPGLLTTPLVALLVSGTIGETVDGLGGATLGSEAIGAGILILTALPLALLSSRSWRWNHFPAPIGGHVAMIAGNGRRHLGRRASWRLCATSRPVESQMR